MRIRSSMLALALSLGAMAAVPAFAASSTAAKPMTSSQQKMAECSHQSKGMKGEAHKTFMSNCLHGKSTAAEPAKTTAAATPMEKSKTTPQERMKTCSADAKTKGLKGDARKSFMSTCLKG